MNVVSGQHYTFFMDLQYEKQCDNISHTRSLEIKYNTNYINKKKNKLLQNSSLYNKTHQLRNVTVSKKNYLDELYKNNKNIMPQCVSNVIKKTKYHKNRISKKSHIYQNAVILMENKTCKLLDIYNVDENGIVKEIFQLDFLKDGHLKRLQDICSSKQIIKVSYCCWYDRTKIINSVWAKNIHGLQKNLHVAHVCPEDGCVCCCKGINLFNSAQITKGNYALVMPVINATASKEDLSDKSNTAQSEKSSAYQQQHKMLSQKKENYNGSLAKESVNDIITLIEVENTETLECYEQNVSNSDVPFIISDVRSLKENYNKKLSPVTSEIVVESSSKNFNKNIGLTITCLQVPGLCVTIDNLTIPLAESVISKFPFIQFRLQDKKLLATPNIDLKITVTEMAIFVQILKKVEDEIKDIVASGTKLNLVIQKMELSNLNGRGVGVFQNEFLSFVTNRYLYTVSQNMFCDKVKSRTLNQYSILTSSGLREPIDVKKDCSSSSSSTLALTSSEQIDLTVKDEIFQNFRNDIPVQSTVFFN